MQIEDEFDLFRARALTGGRAVTGTYSLPVQQNVTDDKNNTYLQHHRSQSERLPEKQGVPSFSYRPRTHTTAVCGADDGVGTQFEESSIAYFLSPKEAKSAQHFQQAAAARQSSGERKKSLLSGIGASSDSTTSNLSRPANKRPNTDSQNSNGKATLDRYYHPSHLAPDNDNVAQHPALAERRVRAKAAHDRCRILTSRDRLISSSSDGGDTTATGGATTEDSELDSEPPTPLFLGDSNRSGSFSSSCADVNHFDDWLSVASSENPTDGAEGYEIVRVRSFVSIGKSGKYVENAGDSVCVRKKPRPRPPLLKRQSELHIRHQWIQEEEACETDPGHCSSADSFDETYPGRRDTVVERPVSAVAAASRAAASSTGRSPCPSPGTADNSPSPYSLAAVAAAAATAVAAAATVPLDPSSQAAGQAQAAFYLSAAGSCSGAMALMQMERQRSASLRSCSSVHHQLRGAGIITNGDELTTQRQDSEAERNGNLDEEAVDADRREETFTVLVLGGCGVGKTSLCHQMLTSEHLVNSADTSAPLEDGEHWLCVVLDEKESSVRIIDAGTLSSQNMVDESIDAFLVVYSCTDKESFQLAVCLIDELRSCAAPKSVPIVLVANKNDLVRSRTVSEKEGKLAARKHGCKYAEVSALLNHMVDRLLVGVVRRMRHEENGGRSAPFSRQASENERGPDEERTLAVAKPSSNIAGCLGRVAEWLLPRRFSKPDGRLNSGVNLFHQ